MEHTTMQALERIENPILIILLLLLIIAVITVWKQYQSAQNRLYDLAVETIGAMKDINNRFADIDDRMERIEAKINNNYEK